MYEAAEEVVKTLTQELNLSEILERVRERGRWTITDLEKAARKASRKINEEIYIGWDKANYLHIWGFHKAELDKEAVKERLSHIEKMIKILEEVLKHSVRANIQSSGANRRAPKRC